MVVGGTRCSGFVVQLISELFGEERGYDSVGLDSGRHDLVLALLDEDIIEDEDDGCEYENCDNNSCEDDWLGGDV